MIVSTLLSTVWLSTTSSFLTMGDMPYTAIDEIALTQPNGSLVQKVATIDHGFVLHLGDLKAGSQACTNERLQTSKALIEQVSTKPFVYTPGDNEWVDCDRKNLSVRFDELERLHYLKGLMFDELYFQKNKQLTGFTSQKHMIENARWQFDNIEFITLHIPGTQNGRSQILKSDKQKAIAAANSRDKLNLEWLHQSLNNQQAKAYVIAFQADVYQATKLPACSQQITSECDAFKIYRDAFSQFAKHTDKPVLLMHGDTGPFCRQKLSDNLTRLNGPGDYVALDIAKVSFVDNDWQISSVKTSEEITTQCNTNPR